MCITEILSEKAFNFSPTEMLNIRKRLFTGIYDAKIPDKPTSKN